MKRDFESKCRAAGLRLTAQRTLILKALSRGGHPDADELHRRVTRDDPRISRATVYRTMRELVAKGLAAEHSFDDERKRFEAAPAFPHNHLVDVDTGRLVEFSDREIERIQERIAAQRGYRIVGSRLVLFAKQAKSKPRGNSKR